MPQPHWFPSRKSGKFVRFCKSSYGRRPGMNPGNGEQYKYLQHNVEGGQVEFHLYGDPEMLEKYF
ncbi:MAG: hypothetical protein ACI92I_000912 [Acidimicrobiales bacterium]|jgi:hypothetical protein